MIFGIIAAILCLGLLLKIVSRKMKWQILDCILKKMHIPCALVVAILIAIHLIVTFDVWQMRSVFLIATGIGAAILLTFIAVIYFFRKKIKSRWIVLHRSVALLFALFVVSHILIYYVDFFSYKHTIATIEISGMNISNVKDGVYIGEFDAGYIYAKVSVTVQKGKLLDVTILEHKNERGRPAEKITNDMIKQQNTKVDAVSGATNSSLVIEKAVENALKKGKS